MSSQLNYLIKRSLNLHNCRCCTSKHERLHNMRVDKGQDVIANSIDVQTLVENNKYLKSLMKVMLTNKQYLLFRIDSKLLIKDGDSEDDP